jgi:Prenyltransferase and squalene oxidase repeat
MDLSEQDPLPFLLSRQNGDGGWGYRKTSSWTEPTCMALLALSARQMNAANAQAASRRWLETAHRKDGGWAPRPSVEESTWVTALAVLAGQEQGPQQGIDWLLSETGRESTILERVREFLLGTKREYGEGTVGWSWYPGTTAWCVPTAVTILALQKWARSDRADAIHKRADVIHKRIDAIHKRADEGREALLARICPDGGWNHGASRALGTDASSYPETTGVVLLALNGVAAPEVDRGIAAALRHYEQCRAIQGRSWLALALLAHGRRPGPIRSSGVECRDTMDAALLILAEAAVEGRNAFLEKNR